MLEKVKATPAKAAPVIVPESLPPCNGAELADLKRRLGESVPTAYHRGDARYKKRVICRIFQATTQITSRDEMKDVHSVSVGDLPAQFAIGVWTALPLAAVEVIGRVKEASESHLQLNESLTPEMIIRSNGIEGGRFVNELMHKYKIELWPPSVPTHEGTVWTIDGYKPIEAEA